MQIERNDLDTLDAIINFAYAVECLMKIFGYGFKRFIKGKMNQ